jgi:predicted DNA-binding protein (MmcQ/YjbR family)
MMLRTVAGDLHQSVRDLCLWLPESEEFLSHGSPNFRVCGKTFATYVVNHHGDRRVALWLPAPDGAQDHYVRSDAKHFFIPPYVGPRGWLGVRLDGTLAWKRIATLVREAYEHVAPSRLTRELGATPNFKTPRKPSAAELDPFRGARAKAVLGVARKICLALPETREIEQFGHPVWQAGKRSFAMARSTDKLTLVFWVGAARQSLLTHDPRYELAPYMGHRGWISLDVSSHHDIQEIRGLALESYRHFALKRMLGALSPGE